MDMKEASEFANKRNKILFASDFDPDLYVRVEEDEGSSFEYKYAFFEIYGVWLMVFSEHHAPRVLHCDDVISVKQYRLIKSAVADIDKWKRWPKTKTTP